MAMALESFSIREYASKMRSVDLEKCWPFDGDGKKEGGGRSLPSMPVRKFRWWADELEAARASEAEKAGSQQAAAVENNEVLLSGPQVEEEEEGGKQTKATARGKQRAPKKRSIMELFAVAPPVEKAADEEASSDDGIEEEDVVDLGQEKRVRGDAKHDNLGAGVEAGGPGKDAAETPRKRKERAKQDEKMAMKKKGMKIINKKKKKKKKLRIEICATKQEKIHDPKVPFVVEMSQLLQCSLHKKQFIKTLKIPIDRQKKKLTGKSFSKAHKHIQSSKVISRNRKDVSKLLPIHSILKSQTRGLPMKKTNVTGDSLGSDIMKLCHDSAKHVSFSGKDDILGCKESSSPMKLPQFQTLCKIFSDVLAASSAMNNSSKNDELPLSSEGAQLVNGSEAETSTSIIEKRNSLPELQQINDAHGHVAPVTLNPSSRNCRDTEKSSLVESVDLNHDLQGYGDLNCFDTENSNLSPNYSYAGSRSQSIIDNEGLHCTTEIHAEGSLPRTSDAGSLPAVGNHVLWSDAVSSLTINRSRSQQSASCEMMHMEDNEREPSSSINPKRGICSHSPDLRQVGFSSPKDLVGSMCSSVGCKRYDQARMAAAPANFGHLTVSSDPISLYRDKHIDEDFVGLPLNSQGELIKNSNSKFGFSEFLKKHNTVLGPGHSFSASNSSELRNGMDHVKMKEKFPETAVYQKYILNQLPEQHYPANKMLTYGSGYIELQGYEGMSIQNHQLVKNKDFILQRDPDMMDFSCHGCREHNQIHHCVNTMREQSQAEGNVEHKLPAIQPTMRLMGKNVTVGRSSKDCQGFDDGKIWTDKEIISEDWNTIRVSDKPPSKEWPEQDCAHPVYKMPKENFLPHLRTPSSFYCGPDINSRPNLMHFDSRPLSMSRDGLSLPIGNHSSPVDSFSHPLPPHALLRKASKPCINPNQASESVKMGHQVPLGSHHQDVCQHMLLGSTHCKHSQSVAYGAALTFHPSFLNQGYVSFAQPSLAPSASNLPQWLLDAAQQAKNQNSSCSSHSKQFAVNQPCNVSGANFFLQSSPYPTSVISFPVFNTTSQACGSYSPASVVQNSVIPSFAVNNSSFASSHTCQNKVKSRDGTKSRFTYFEGQDHANRNRKRIAAKDDEFMKPAKKPALMMGDSNSLIGQRGTGQLDGYTQLKTRTLDFHACGSKTIDVSHPVVGTDDEPSTQSRSGSFKLDGVSRSGPFKLSAGAKHILKPSQTLGQDNSRPIHSTVPFAVGNPSGNVPVSRKKTAKIYRF